MTVYAPRPLTSGAKVDGRFSKQDFVYLPEQDVYRSPPGAAAAPHDDHREGADTSAIHNLVASARTQARALNPQFLAAGAVGGKA